jgi:hypothetical protein
MTLFCMHVCIPVCPSRQHKLPSLLSSPFSSPLPRSLSLSSSTSLSPSLSPHLPPLSLPLSLSIFPSPSCSLPAAVTPRPLLGTDGGGGGGGKESENSTQAVFPPPQSPPPLISPTRKELCSKIARIVKQKIKTKTESKIPISVGIDHTESRILF